MTNKAKLVNARLNVFVNQAILYDPQTDYDTWMICLQKERQFQRELAQIEALVYQEAIAA